MNCSRTSSSNRHLILIHCNPLDWRWTDQWTSGHLMTLWWRLFKKASQLVMAGEKITERVVDSEMPLPIKGCTESIESPSQPIETSPEAQGGPSMLIDRPEPNRQRPSRCLCSDTRIPQGNFGQKKAVLVEHCWLSVPLALMITPSSCSALTIVGTISVIWV